MIVVRWQIDNFLFIFQADTAFHYCIKNKDVEMMNLLLSAGVPVNITDGKLQTPLHTAAATGRDRHKAHKYKCLVNRGGFRIS